MPISRQIRPTRSILPIVVLLLSSCDAGETLNPQNLAEGQLPVTSSQSVAPDIAIPGPGVRADIRWDSGPGAGVATSGTGTVAATSNENGLVKLTTLEAAVAPAQAIFWHALSGTTTLWRMNGAAFSGEVAARTTLPSPWNFAAAADMNGDGHTDMIAENTSDGMKIITYMNGTTFTGAFKVAAVTTVAWKVVGAADMNGDAKADIIIANPSTGDHAAMIMNGDTYTGTTAALPLVGLPFHVTAAGDFNGDNKTDLIWQNASDGSRYVTYMNGTSLTSYVYLGTVPLEWRIVAATDFNADGKQDLLMHSATTGHARVYIMQGSTLPSSFTQLQAAPTSQLPVAATRVLWTVADVAPPPPPPPPPTELANVSALRAAIANAAPYSRVNIPAGVYDLGNTGIKIENKQGVEIFGAGRGQTILRAGGTAAYILELVGTNDNLKVASMTLEGAASLGTNTHGLASGFNRISLRGARYYDLEIKNVAVGISVVGSGSGVCNDIEITDNYLTNIQDRQNSTGATSGSGYGIHSDGCSQVRIAGNSLKNVDRHSIYIAGAYQPDRTGPGSLIVENNLIVDHARTASINQTWLVALAVARSSNVVVAHNVIVNSYQDAISIENPPQEGRTYVVQNVRLIGNTVLGSRGADVFLTASGGFSSWGNRFFHSDAAAAPSTPFIRKDGAGLSGSLVEPSAFAGTQSMATVSPFGAVTFMHNNVLVRATTVYNTDPSTWSRINSGHVWAAVEDIAVSSNKVFVAAARRLVEVDPVTLAWRSSPTVFPARSVSVHTGGRLVLAGGNQLFVFDGSLVSSASTVPGSGTVRGMAGYKGKLYLYAGSCHYEVDPTTLASTTIGC